MQEHEISTVDDLDAALRMQALRTQSKLWKVATGRSFGWVAALGLVLALLLVLTGFVQYIDNDADGTIKIALGMVLIASFIWSHTQRQLNALVEIVKRLDADRARASE